MTHPTSALPEWKKEFRRRFVEEDTYQTGVFRMGGFVDPDSVESFISILINSERQKAVENAIKEFQRVISPTEYDWDKGAYTWMEHCKALPQKDSHE